MAKRELPDMIVSDNPESVCDAAEVFTSRGMHMEAQTTLLFGIFQLLRKAHGQPE